MSLRKRSLSIAGHPTSLALEPEFWAALNHAAREDGVGVAAMAARIDAARDPGQGLASAIRVFLLLRATRAAAQTAPAHDR